MGNEVQMEADLTALPEVSNAKFILVSLGWKQGRVDGGGEVGIKNIFCATWKPRRTSSG